MSEEDLSGHVSSVSLDPVKLFLPEENNELLSDILDGSKLTADLVLGFDLEIRAKKERLVGACTIRNSLLPIFSLPDEILSHIIFLSSVSFGGDDSRFDGVYALRWMKLTTVCRRFREAILTTHALWTYISVCSHRYSGQYTKLERVGTQLERSGVLPLSVRFQLERDSMSSYLLELYGSPENERFYLLNPSRLRELHIESPVSLMRTWLLDFAATTYPLLEKLVLKADTYKHDSVADPLPLMVPNTLFTGASPRMHSLKLENVSIDLEPVHNLVEFSMWFDDDKMEAQGPSYHFSAIVSSLSRSPNLTSIKLFLPWNSSSAFLNLGRIALPSLDYLRLRGAVMDCADFLHAIQVPPTVRTDILPQGLHSGPLAQSIMLRLREIYRGYIQGAPETSICRLVLEGSSGYMTMKALAPFKSGLFSNPSPVHPYLIELNSHPRREVYRRQILTRFIDALPMHNLTHLDMRLAGNDVVTAATWKTIILRLPSLQHISVSPFEQSFISLPTALLLLHERGNNVSSLQQIRVHGRYYGEISMREWGDMGDTYELAVADGKKGLGLLKLYMRLRRPFLPVLELNGCSALLEGLVTYPQLQRLTEKLIVDGNVYDEKVERSRTNGDT